MSEIYQNEYGAQVQLLSREEANLISNFISQVGVWTAKHGNKASRIEIIYYPEDDGFDIISNEANNGILPRNRISAFRGELMSWASQQTQQLKGWTNERVVTAFAVIHKDGQFGVLCQTADANATGSNTSAEDALPEDTPADA